MRNFVIKILLIICLVNSTDLCIGQIDTDSKFLFKTWFFLEHSNTKIRNDSTFSKKDFDLFKFYDDVLTLNFDTLEAGGFSKDFLFLSITQYKDNVQFDDSALVISKNTYDRFITIPVFNCAGYVLGVNKRTGRSYRLRGFSGNDFLSFLRDVKSQHLLSFRKSISSNQFFRQYTVSGVDFRCIYQGLTKKDQNLDKYPCLRTCEDYKITIN